MAVTLVCGPPGSGKTKYVRDHARWGDLVLDLDTIHEAISGQAMYDKPAGLLTFALAARDAILNRLAQPSEVKTAWIIAGLSRASERRAMAARFNAHVVVLEVSPSECMRRISQDERRKARAALWAPIVAKWWNQYQATEGDRRIKG